MLDTRPRAAARADKELVSPDGSRPLHVMLPAAEAVASRTACPAVQLVMLLRL